LEGNVKKTVCILYGGKSQEHEVSLQSAASVFNYINKEKFSTIAIGIERDGTWHYQKEIKITSDPARGNMLVCTRQKEPLSIVPGRGFFFKGNKLPVDIVFPVLHGSFGEDGTVQGLLEMLDLPYVGAGVLGSALAIDKEKVKRVWKEAGLPVVEFDLIRNEEYFSSPEKRDRIVASIEARFSYPVFVKPSCTGSSVGVQKVSTRGDLVKAVEHAFELDTKVLIEHAVEAREIECSVIGNNAPRAFAPGEVIPAHSFYSYEAKYLDPKGAELIIPAAIDRTLAERVMDLAVRAYRCAEVEGLSRVDLFLDKKTGELWLNEINTLPGFTNISMFPRMCEAGGLPYAELLEALIQYGFQRFHERANLRYKL
jgi:D-alanine-D-alanine ligase